MEVGLAVQQLSHSWRNFALKNIELSIPKGDYFVLLGPTGSGKTLLLEAIVGAYRPHVGRIIVDGQDVTKLPPEKRGISYAPQNYLLFENMTVRENVEFGLHARAVPPKDRQERAERVMGLLGISHLANREPRNLSGGEKQRVSLARAMAVEPRLVLLDEPLSAVDAATKDSIIEELRRVHDETEITMVHVTHDQMEAASLADRIGVVSGGQILQVGTRSDILQTSSRQATFVKIDNMFSGIVLQRTFDLAVIDIGEGAQIEAITRRSGDVMVHISPEDLIVSKQPVTSSARNNFAGNITEITDLGATVRLKIAGEKEFTVIITRRSFFDMQLNIGSRVHVFFKASAVHVL